MVVDEAEEVDLEMVEVVVVDLEVAVVVEAVIEAEMAEVAAVEDSITIIVSAEAIKVTKGSLIKQVLQWEPVKKLNSKIKFKF